MRNSRFLFYSVLTAVLLAFPAVGFSDDTVDEGARLGKTCAGCHGTNGNTPGEYIGKIGGQNSAYMAKALKEFAAGARPMSIEMSIISKGYTEAQLDAIAAYYSGKQWVASVNQFDSAKAEAGKAIAAENGCMDCHGAAGEGMDSYPRIGGQNKGYLAEVLKKYRAGGIKSDEMSMITSMSDEQIEALANYMTSLR
jgi:sulfide dehydrogenase cytochrome subunit